MKQFLLHNHPPYICTPITGGTKQSVLSQLDAIVGEAPDIIEWRADFLHELGNTALILEIIEAIKEKTELPLLFTIRAEHEGGEKINLTEEEKVQLLTTICEQSSVDIIDYEISNYKKNVLVLRKISKRHQKKLILSYHNFIETPSNEELLQKAKQARDFEADVAKFAVMPNNKEDVYQLLNVTKQLDQTFDLPIITMSMGELGAISRVIGWTFGSVMTFGVAVDSSAPGQVPVGKLRDAITSTKDLIPGWK